MKYLIPLFLSYLVIRRKQAENILKYLSSFNIIEKELLLKETKLLNKRGI